MRIKHLTVHNYRSIGHLSMECKPHTTLLGPNNHGKSNLIRAIEFCLSTSAKAVEDDLFIHRDPGDDELWVEITFHELTDQEKNTFRRYILSDNTLQIRKTARLQQDGKFEIAYNGYIEQPDEEWLRPENAGDLAKRDVIEQTPLKELVPQTGKLSRKHIEEAQQRYIQQHCHELTFAKTLENGPLLGTKNVGGGVLPDFYLIPAVRDLTDEIKVKATTAFGRLLSRAVREMAERDPRFGQARENIEQVIRSLNARDGEARGTPLAELEQEIENALRDWGVSVSIEVAPPELERLFELGTDVNVFDGVKTTAARKGHGLQRAMMFALLRIWADMLQDERKAGVGQGPAPRKGSDSVVFAIEEPELFLHPHAQRKLSASLREIADAPEHQVFICTHSTHFIDLNRYKEVAIIKKDSAERGSYVKQCARDLFEGGGDERKKRFQMAQWINPDRAELFFAQRVVFVEGETEKVALPFLADKLGVANPDVSVIDCGSKHNLPLYIEIAKAFEIPYLVVHDEDPLPDPMPETWNENKRKEKRRTFELNEEVAKLVEEPLGRVVVLSPNFEGVAGISKSQGEKKGKALAALDHFEAMGEEEIPEQLREVVRRMFE